MEVGDDNSPAPENIPGYDVGDGTPEFYPDIYTGDWGNTGVNPMRLIPKRESEFVTGEKPDLRRMSWGHMFLLCHPTIFIEDVVIPPKH